MKYINKKTGVLFETDCLISGEPWEPVEEPAPKPEPAEEPEPEEAPGESDAEPKEKKGKKRTAKGGKKK